MATLFPSLTGHSPPAAGRPTLLGTGSDRLLWTKWLPLAGKLVASRAVLGLAGATSPCMFTRGGLAGFSRTR